MTNRFEIIIYWSDEDKAFVADVPELPGCMAHGDTYESALDSIKSAMDLLMMEQEEDLSKHDPLHAVYIYAQNKVSVLVEQLSDFPALSKLTNALEKADDIYLPSGSPTSPLTKSYFS